jgi:hypothetical protein
MLIILILVTHSYQPVLLLELTPDKSLLLKWGRVGGLESALHLTFWG